MKAQVIAITVLVFLLTSKLQVYAQINWDENYPETDVAEVLRFEQEYADSIDAKSGKEDYYFRTAKFRFGATYLGQSRKLDPGVLRSMSNVFKLRMPDYSPAALVNNEYLFLVAGKQIWAPIQRQIENAFNREIKNGSEVMLYTLFLNEHSDKGLFNTFLISEFQQK